MQEITIREMAVEDLPGADDLRRLAGWNQTFGDWTRLLRFEPHGCFVATLKGAVVGTVTTTTYGNPLAWIGMMLVQPERRRLGIGTQLMRQALQSLEDKQVKCVKLDATPAGFPLYQRLGFVGEWTLSRHLRPPGANAVSTVSAPGNTRPLRDSDWGAVAEIDAQAFGAGRIELLRGLAQECRRAVVWPAAGPVLGWGLLRPGANADYLGPVACAKDEGSVSLVRALLSGTEDRAVFWDIPDQNPAARATAREQGFTVVRSLTRMRLGPETLVSSPGAQFAIADPALG